MGGFNLLLLRYEFSHKFDCLKWTTSFQTSGIAPLAPCTTCCQLLHKEWDACPSIVPLGRYRGTVSTVVTGYRLPCPNCRQLGSVHIPKPSTRELRSTSSSPVTWFVLTPHKPPSSSRLQLPLERFTNATSYLLLLFDGAGYISLIIGFCSLFQTHVFQHRCCYVARAYPREVL